VPAFTFDAENHLTSTAGQTYLYDGDGKRVEKASGSPLTANKLYWYGTEDSPVLETDAAGNELYRYFRFQGLLTTREEANDWVDHYGLDALGNVRWLYSYNGAWDVSDYYPFGGERIWQSNSTNTRKFTGKERDTESGLDNFGARYFTSTFGRFMSPDEPLLDQEARDPQSWNLYGYVRNNPLNNTDPTGNACVQNADGNFQDNDSGGQSCADAGQAQEVFVNSTPLNRTFLQWIGLDQAYNQAISWQYLMDLRAGKNPPLQTIAEIPFVPEIGELDAFGMSAEELQVFNELREAGVDIQRLPVSGLPGVKSADFLINGVPTELKTLEAAGPNTLKNAIEKASAQGEQVLIDARKVDISASSALSQAQRAQGNIGGLVGRITVLTKQGPVKF